MFCGEFTMRKINIYSANVEINCEQRKKKSVATTKPTSKQTNKQINKHAKQKKIIANNSVCVCVVLCANIFLKMLAKLLNCYLNIDLFVFGANETINPTIVSDSLSLQYSLSLSLPRTT